MLLVLLVVSSCVEARDADDPRCEDPSIGSVSLDASDTIDLGPVPTKTAAVGGFCDGSLEIKLVAVEALGPGSIEDYSYIDPYDGPFFAIDGRCHFYALDNAFPRLTEGDVSADLLAQLTAELRLDTLADLPSSKDTLSPHYVDALLATATHSLRCRDMQCRTPEATATLEQAMSWIRKLAAQGRPSTGEMTAFAFPVSMPPDPMDDREMHVVAWPLAPTIRSLRGFVVSDFSPTGGLRLGSALAGKLRKLRSEYIHAFEPSRDFEPATINVSDCGQTYRLLLRDQMPGWLHGDVLRFLETAWTRPVIQSCIVDVYGPEVTPCPEDY
jgi:hypothetical protein